MQDYSEFPEVESFYSNPETDFYTCNIQQISKNNYYVFQNDSLSMV